MTRQDDPPERAAPRPPEAAQTADQRPGATGGGPLDGDQSPATRADIVSAARWLEERLALTRQDLAALHREFSANKSMVNDHLVLIRSGLARLEGTFGKATETVQRDSQAVQRRLQRRDGRVRGMGLAALAGLIIGLALGWAGSVETAVAWVRSVWING